jgi:hypothetical protein
MPKRTTKKRVARTPIRAKQPLKRKPVRRTRTVKKKRRAGVKTLRASLGKAGWVLKCIIPTKLKHPLVCHKERLHPYIRTMLLSLTAGTAGVIASTIYYVHVAEATKPFLEARAVPAAAAVSLSETPFVELAEGIDAGGGEETVTLRPPPKEYLRQRAAELGYNAALLDRIAYCESRWRMVKNRISTAYGYFQIVDGTERMTPQYRAGYRKTDPYANIEMALYLYGKQGTRPWFASRRCWSQ